MHRRALLIAAAAVFSVAGLAGPPALAEAEQPFTDAAFQAAQAAGKPILVEVHAVWCPTCARQRPIIAKLLAEQDFAGLVVLRVDFDDQKDVVRRFDVPMQSALIVFHGTAERGRSIGDTQEASIRALLEKSAA